MDASSGVPRPPDDVALRIEARCDDCVHIARERGITLGPGQVTLFPRQHGFVLFEMRSPDESPWYLCGHCWFQGLHSNKPESVGTGRVLETASAEIWQGPDLDPGGAAKTAAKTAEAKPRTRAKRKPAA